MTSYYIFSLVLVQTALAACRAFTVWFGIAIKSLLLTEYIHSYRREFGDRGMDRGKIPPPLGNLIDYFIYRPPRLFLAMRFQ